MLWKVFSALIDLWLGGVENVGADTVVDTPLHNVCFPAWHKQSQSQSQMHGICGTTCHLQSFKFPLVKAHHQNVLDQDYKTL